MPKKKEKLIVATKQNFLLLCQQYDQFGAILKTASRQYMEIGEHLKVMGQNLDDMGGDPILQPKVEDDKKTDNKS